MNYWVKLWEPCDSLHRHLFDKDFIIRTNVHNKMMDEYSVTDKISITLPLLR